MIWGQGSWRHGPWALQVALGNDTFGGSCALLVLVAAYFFDIVHCSNYSQSAHRLVVWMVSEPAWSVAQSDTWS